KPYNLALATSPVHLKRWIGRASASGPGGRLSCMIPLKTGILSTERVFPPRQYQMPEFRLQTQWTTFPGICIVSSNLKMSAQMHTCEAAGSQMNSGAELRMGQRRRKLGNKLTRTIGGPYELQCENARKRVETCFRRPVALDCRYAFNRVQSRTALFGIDQWHCRGQDRRSRGQRVGDAAEPGNLDRNEDGHKYSWQLCDCEYRSWPLYDS